MRPHTPVVIYNANGYEQGRIGDDGCIEWDSRGADVPIWLFGLVITGIGMVALGMVLLVALLSTPANSQPHPAPQAPAHTPAPHGAPRTAN